MLSRPRAAPSGAHFRPRFALALVYLFAFLLLYALALVAPALLETFRALPPGPQQEDLSLAAEVARRTVRPRLPLAALAALATVALGIRARALPGLRPPV